MKLTPRQLEILRGLAAGLGDKQIADIAGCSVHTVRFHIRCMMAEAKRHTRCGMLWEFRLSLSAGSQPDDSA